MEYDYVMAPTEGAQFRRNEKRDEVNRPVVFMRDVTRRFARLQAPSFAKVINIRDAEGNLVERIAP